MTRHISYPTLGTCSRQIDIELEDGIIRSVTFTGGCHGNTQGIAALVRGMKAADAIARLEGIDCRGKGHFVPRPVGQSPQAGALNRRSYRSGTDFAHGAANQNRNTMYFVWYLLLGLASGWIANLIVKGSGSGLIVNLVVGLVGGVLGGWLFSFFGLVPAGTLGSLATSVIGAVVLLWIAAAISHKKIR